ncbi:PREDICTED: phosphoinositide phosphatase SAC3-like [Camelina sativa]|uniref:Phosphoinositide phosphatase SAC3-like n=1 Tax=Camelina sativa TaxID=90675 RepID=A0ABM0TFW5_CAMSA|nr:PREDICTED: phosphoinositide phosphatase SAC3-like [Camelina sativa]
MSINHESMPQKGFSAPLQHVSHIHLESSSDIPVSNDVALSRCTPSMPRKQLFGDVQKVHRFGSDQVYFGGEEDMSSVSNFVDIEWLSSSENSCVNALFDRSSALTRNLTTSSTENIINVGQSAHTTSESGSSSSKGKEPMGTKIREDFADSFKEWVAYGEALCH